jgi:beta-alanine degradation protein BauB
MKKQFNYLLIFSILLVFVHYNEANAQDVAKVGGNVYKLLVDTLGVRMFEVTFNPGDKVAMHSHPDHAVYALSGGSLEITNDKGHKEVVEITSGMAAIFPAETHSARNLGNSTIKAIVMEINRPRMGIKK